MIISPLEYQIFKIVFKVTFKPKDAKKLKYEMHIIHAAPSYEKDVQMEYEE